ncbi:NADP-specific glutamate dehydrogenase [Rhizoctonia solani]|uniref:NADP-specific glutamate dehydrogenase n=1 Tax=Rhizoctonia solani TaxID=456999 RepID=A0A0K6FRM3_9AGAM|nr:NADP-specific glutamate dehydrogenase [Rhizoctonia solani]
MSNYPSEPEFEQAVNEITSTLAPFLAKHPEYERALEVAKIPERVIQFRVTWEADDGTVRVNRGYRVQFNSALGPYKGGLRLHPSRAPKRPIFSHETHPLDFQQSHHPRFAPAILPKAHKYHFFHSSKFHIKNEAYYSSALDSVRVKMPDGDIFQWPMIKKPEGPYIQAIWAEMQMVTPDGGKTELFRAIYDIIRDETHRQLGDAFYHVQLKFVHQRVLDYVTAKARAEYPILMRFKDDWATLDLLRRCMKTARAVENGREAHKPNPVKERKRKRESE